MMQEGSGYKKAVLYSRTRLGDKPLFEPMIDYRRIYALLGLNVLRKQVITGPGNDVLPCCRFLDISWTHANILDIETWWSQS